MDEPKNIAAVDVIKKLIANIIPDAKVTANYNHSSHCVFYTEDAGPVITLDGDLIDDFNSAIEKHSDTSYRRGLEWTIKFRIYAALASAGVFPNVLISKELLAEEQVWLKGLNVRFDSDPRLDSIFVLGLKALKEFLTNLTVKYPSSTPPEILNELKCVNDILAYYEERKSFSSSGVSETSLGYLKAAAICEIIKKERERDAITIPRILKEKSKEIYSIVAKLSDE